MNRLKFHKDTRMILKVGLISLTFLGTIALLLLPILTVDAEETVARSVAQPGLAYMFRQDATSGILLLGSVLVLIVVGGTLHIINQDRLHRPHLLQHKAKSAKEAKEEVSE